MMMGKVHHNSRLLGSLSFALMLSLSPSPCLGTPKPNTADGHAKPESQWTPDERRVVVQDQHLKSIIIFEGPLDTNELASDGVNLSKHEINVGFVNSLPKKWLTFSQGLRNANHTQTLNLADIYGRFVYEDNIIRRRSHSGKVLMALIDDELTVGISHARNGEFIDIIIRKGASPSSEVTPLTFQPYSLKERPGLGVYFPRKKSQALEMIMSFIKMVENQNDEKVKQIRTDNRNEFRNHELESFCDEKGISQKIYSPYTPEQNGVAERKNRTLVKAARTILNGSDHLGKFDAKADDGYFLGYSSVLNDFRVYNTRRQQIEETYHVTFDESMKAIKFTNTLVDEIGIGYSSRYPLDEFLHEDDPSRQYQDIKDPPDLINTKWTHKQNVQDDQMITQPTYVPSENYIEVSRSITKPLVHNVTQSHIPNQASTSSHLAPQDRWSRDQHIELVNIIVARMEAIRIFLAFAIYMNFKVFQMDVKSAFPNGKLKEKVYVKHPPGFENSEFHDYICKLDKALYRIKQAPKA
nr:hypothetical protein [Tanacetum cinerariifolium]